MPADWLGHFLLTLSAASAITALSWLWFVAISFHSNVEQTTHEQCEACGSDGEQIDSHGPSVNVSNLRPDQEGPEAERQRREEQHRCAEIRYWNRELFAAWVMITLTAVAGAVGVGGLYTLLGTLNATFAQVEIATRQLEAMQLSERTVKLSERPWVSHVMSLEKVERISDGSLRFRVRHELKNHGRSVALYVRFDGRVAISSGGALNPFAERDAICAMQIEKRGGNGVVVFPDQVVSEVRQETIEADEIADELSRLRLANGDDHRLINVVALACTTYQTSYEFSPSLTEMENHQTGHVFMVGVPEPDGNVTSINVDAPQAGISLVEFPHGAFAK